MRAQFRFDLLQFAIVLVTAIIFNPFIVLGQRNDNENNGQGQFWRITGNQNIDDAVNFIGTTNSQDFIIKTKDAEHARITKHGNFGIGTQHPTSKLGLKGELSFPLTSFGTNIKDKISLYSNRLGQASMVGFGFERSFLFSTNNGSIISVVDLYSRAEGAHRWYSNVLADRGISASMVLSKAGNLGVGMRNPTKKLDIDGQVRIRGGNPNSGFVLVSDVNGVGTWTNPNAIDGDWKVVGNTMYALPSGNIGKGTSNPQEELHLYRNAVTPVGVLMGNSLTGNGRRGFLVDYHSSGGAELWNFENTDMWFGTNGTRRMTIKANGGVGIGTSNPREELHLYRNAVTPVGVLMGNSLTGNGRRGFLVDYHSSGGAELWNFENTDMWFGTNGSRRMTIKANGDVGIGTSNPNGDLTVSANDAKLVVRDNATNNSANAARLELLEYAGGSFSGGGYMHWDGSKNQLRLGTKESGNPDKIVLVVDRSRQNVGIGTTNPNQNYKLSVNGKIRAKEVVVETGWSDFVFDEGYELKTLKEVEQFINEHGHLPGIPSATEVDENGVKLGEMGSKLLMKIEELTLYMMQMKAELEQIKQENLDLRNQIIASR